MREFACATAAIAIICCSVLPVTAEEVAAVADVDAGSVTSTNSSDRITVLATGQKASLPEREPVAAVAPIEPPAPKPAVRPLPPSLTATVDLSKQRMVVSENGKLIYSWPISSGRAGYRTPTGTYRPQWLSRMHYSKKYDNAPMPYSVFFHEGYAIHATYATKALGRPASHGCIRLAPSHAKLFYKLVEKHGKGRTRIALSGVAPAAVASDPTRDRKSAAASDWAAPQARRRRQGRSRSYYVQPHRYVWPGDQPVRYRPRYGATAFGY